VRKTGLEVVNRNKIPRKSRQWTKDFELFSNRFTELKEAMYKKCENAVLTKQNNKKKQTSY
jgi:hypothetical protein